MKILLAPTSYKGTLNAFEVADCMASAIRKVSNEIEIISTPLSDGGDGSLEILAKSLNAKVVTTKTTDPLGRIISAPIAIFDNGKSIYIEMAKASGLTLLSPTERNPNLTSTYGTGQLIQYALSFNPAKIIIGLGGSATNDAGTGIANALGVDFLDKKNTPLTPRGENLIKINAIKMEGLDSRIKKTRFVAVCDVMNRPLGKNGASILFSPQKGATKTQAISLEKGIKHFLEVVKKKFKKDLSKVKGAGAAGGCAISLASIFNAQISSGAEFFIKITQFTKKLKSADLVITSEGNLDRQSLLGKTTVTVAKYAKKFKKPVIAICPQVSENPRIFMKHNITAVFSILNKPMSLRETIENTKPLLINATEQIVRILLLSKPPS